jgi:hypothetical protein
MNTKLLYARAKNDPSNFGLGYIRWHQPLSFSFINQNNPIATIELINATPNDVPFCIVHGWDRDAGMKHIFTQHYSFPRLQVVTDVYNDLVTYTKKGSL